LLINAQAANNPTSITPTATSLGGISPPSQMIFISNNQNNNRPGTNHNAAVKAYEGYQTLQPN
jgi:hypothetical protein